MDRIRSIASASSCAQYSWKNRGRAPAGYIQGMALSFARSWCRLEGSRALMSPAQVMSKANTRDTSKDALAYYADIFGSLKMEIETSGEDTLRSDYTLATGLGMRESSGKYCTGYDTTASNQSASTAEAGLFQTSYNSMGASDELKKLYDEYRANKDKCLLPIYKQSVSCSGQSIVGSGAGAEYQQFNKDCPAFATEYVAIMLRVLRAHYGPINRKEAEVNPSCNTMLKQVRDLVANDPRGQKTACDELW